LSKLGQMTSLLNVKTLKYIYVKGIKLSVASLKRFSYIVLDCGSGIYCVACIERLVLLVDWGGGRSSIVSGLCGQYYDILLLSCSHYFFYSIGGSLVLSYGDVAWSRCEQ
jgi:hypothetical protein